VEEQLSETALKKKLLSDSSLWGAAGWEQNKRRTLFGGVAHLIWRGILVEQLSETSMQLCGKNARRTVRTENLGVNSLREKQLSS
jgi:hypothetical protein